MAPARTWSMWNRPVRKSLACRVPRKTTSGSDGASHPVGIGTSHWRGRPVRRRRRGVRRLVLRRRRARREHADRRRSRRRRVGGAPAQATGQAEPSPGSPAAPGAAPPSGAGIVSTGHLGGNFANCWHDSRPDQRVVVGSAADPAGQAGRLVGTRAEVAACSGEHDDAIGGSLADLPERPRSVPHLPVDLVLPSPDG